MGTEDGLHLIGKVRRTDWLPVRHTYEAMQEDQVVRSDTSMDEYDSEEEELSIRPYDYCPSDRSDYVDSDADSFADYDAAIGAIDEDELHAAYNFEFTAAIGRGLPDLSEL